MQRLCLPEAGVGVGNPLVGEKECHVETVAEPARPACRTVSPVSQSCLEADSLTTNRDEFGYLRVDRYRPLFRHPIVGRLRVDGISDGVGCGVGDKRLHE